MNIRYENLLSPLRIGNALLKNRMVATAATPHFIQGTEPYPTEKWVTMIANRAKNGAAAVFINHLENASPQQGSVDVTADHFCKMDMSNTSTHNYLCQMIDSLRYYGSLAVSGPMGHISRENEEQITPPGAGGHYRKPVCNDLTKTEIHEYIDSIVREAVTLSKLGFEMISLHNAYCGTVASQLWSPLCNSRKDEYGGSLKNRARLLLEIYDALRQTLGRGFPLECLVSGEEAGGITVQDTIELAKMAEGLIDILHIRHGEQDPQHPTGFTSTREKPCPNADAAAAVKESVKNRGGKIAIAVSAGLQDPDYCEMLLREGKADIIAMARSWICDSEYGRKIYEGRGEDVVPCVRCNKCHVPNESDKFRSFCTVNPSFGLEDKLDRMILPIGSMKKVAIIGGGPSGMYAAITAAERGHRVTLYEKAAVLGGQLTHTDYAADKWPLKDFKDYLIRRLYKTGVNIRLNTYATRDELMKEGYDEVIAAIGPVFTKPGIPGADGSNVLHATDVYGHSQELPHRIAVIGGSETGVETAMYLAENGHDCTVMTRQSDLALDAPRAHYVTMLRDAYRKLPGFNQLTNVKYTLFDENGVVYQDSEGTERRLEAELIVLAGGAEPDTAGASALYGAASRTQYAGDCCRIGNVHMAVTAGFAAANQI